MAPILLWLVMVLCLLISVVKYVMGIILKLAFPAISNRGRTFLLTRWQFAESKRFSLEKAKGLFP